MKRFFLLFLSIGIFACSTKTSDNSSIHIADLPAGDSVKKSGKKLISRPLGFVQIDSENNISDSTLIITVHGFISEGYEWIKALNKFTENYSKVYFYRYDWNKCPDVVGQDLAQSIDSLLSINNSYNDIKIYGHSYGGLVVTFSASLIENPNNFEIHTIASPLAGYPRIMDKCDLNYNDENVLEYPKWSSNIEHFQWRTQQEQDGAFIDMEYDPQVIDLPSSTVTVLPDSMDGHRLGHNWSVTWVINKILSNE